MKKTLLLTSLVASMVEIAGTTGSVKSFAESEAKFETKKSVSNDQKEVETNTTKSYEVGKIGIETEVKVKGSGLSFGGTFQAEKLSLDPAPTKDKFLDHSKVWAKYVPVEGLTIEGEVSVPVKFGVVTKTFGKVSSDKTKYDSANPVKGFGYDSTSIKTSLNLKYEWK